MSKDVNNKESEYDYKKEMAHYRRCMNYLTLDIPIQVLCLPAAIENALTRSDYIRLYDLINRDLTKIKGIGVDRAALITSRLDEFCTVSI